MCKPILLILVFCMSMVLKAQVSKTITNLAAGELKSVMTAEELNSVTQLSVSGTMDARDFKTIKDHMPALKEVDLANVTVERYMGTDGPANTIPEGALYGNSSITTLILPTTITRIGTGAFGFCNRLTSVNLPSSVISIGDEAFYNCIALTSVNISSSITSIGKGAFLGCTNLHYITIPASVTTIGASVFSNCTAEIVVDSENSNYSSIDGVLFNKDQTELIQCPVSKTDWYIVPASVKTIGISAFSNCSLLTSVILPNSVTSIGNNAFGRCTGLTTITIPASVTRLNGAFYGCTGLISVNLPNSVTSLDGEFQGCTALEAVTIPASVTTLERAFMDCSGLKSVTFPSSLTMIGEDSFYGCTGLTSITIPNSVTTIIGAFGDCSGLTSVTFPNSVTTIGDDSFYYCTGLTSVTIPNSVTTIGAHAFLSCTSLKSVTLPNSVTTIGNSAFYGCKELSTLSISASLTSLGHYAFAYCDQLATITAYPTTPPQIPSSLVFEGVNKNTCTLYVPAGSLDLYQTSFVWKDFLNAGVITSTGKDMKKEAISISPNPAKDVITVHASKGVASIYNSNGKLVITQSLEDNKQVNIHSLQPGLYVVVVNGESFKMIKE